MNDLKTEKKSDNMNFEEEQLISVTFQLKSTNAEELEIGAERLQHFFNEKKVDFVIKNSDKRSGKVTTRKGPSGQGTCTMAKYKINVFSKDISLKASYRVISSITSFMSGIGLEANILMSD